MKLTATDPFNEIPTLKETPPSTPKSTTNEPKSNHEQSSEPEKSAQITSQIVFDASTAVNVQPPKSALKKPRDSDVENRR